MDLMLSPFMYHKDKREIKQPLPIWCVIWSLEDRYEGLQYSTESGCIIDNASTSNSLQYMLAIYVQERFTHTKINEE